MKYLLKFSLGSLVLTSAVATAAFTNADRRVNPGARISLTSSADPFKHLRLLATPKPSEPVCCLIPSPSDAVPSPAEFLSFDEWKSRQLELQAQSQSAVLNHTPSYNTSTSYVPPDSPSVPTSIALGDTEAQLPPSAETTPVLSPHFPVPLTDRFNYASLDCSARVHTSHRSARFPSAILSSKKDRYMLSPCSANPNFIVVELCDDIRIDTVQLANFEFFSGVFRDFRVSVAQTYTSDGHGWVEAGTYTAKNIRGVQSFHPQVELRPFYRYVRIDFLSHYGNEFYCPVSLLRVYGLTQLEEWKWEVWRGGSESVNTKSAEDIIQKNKPQIVTPDPSPSNKIALNSTMFGTATAENIPTNEDTKPTSSTEGHIVPVSQQQETSLFSAATSNIFKTTTQSVTQTVPTHVSAPVSSPPTDQVGVSPVEKSIAPNSTSHLTNITASVSGPESLNMSTSSISTLPTMTPVPSPAPVASGESIFRTIMNRLTMLEANTTLYHKYVEEQTLHMRDALRRLEEDVGRVDGISKAQQQLFSRTVDEWERRRYQMEEERSELLHRVNHLTEEVTLEKRLGIAQLCLLLTVLIFMALTRGSRTDASSLLNGTMHGFRRRSPWSSMDWIKKSRKGRSRTPTPAHFPWESAKKSDSKAVVITSPIRNSTSPQPKTPRSATPHTPLRRPTTPRHRGALPSGAGRPTGRLHRSNSHTLPARMSTSTKRIARSAHLHQVQTSARRLPEIDGGDSETHNREKDGTVGFQRSHEKGKWLDGKRSSSILGAAASEGSEPESWIDTEPGSETGDFEPDCGIQGQDIGTPVNGFVLGSPFREPISLNVTVDHPINHSHLPSDM
ncbi:UNC-like C-terminal-domain-containing protein [Hysterangium stoloniferum]|nr:UNC-like C-terminal-domain-containing protein [Hysterangium stoloniferum]